MKQQLDLTKEILIKVKIIEGKYKGQTIPLATSLEDLMVDDLSTQLINANVFSCIGHPCDHYELLSIEY